MESAETPVILTESIGATLSGDDLTLIQPGINANRHSTAPYIFVRKVGMANTKRQKFDDFECRQCGKTYVSRKCLQSHSCSPSNFPCGKCEKNFSTPNYLHNHLVRIHPSSEAALQWKCSDCPSRFAFKSQLKSHSYGHSNIFYACDNCEVKFKHPQNLKSHKRLKHPVALPVTTYRCYACQQPFYTLVDLNQHRLIQHGYQPIFPCVNCQLIFESSTALLAHIDRMHKMAD